MSDLFDKAIFFDNLQTLWRKSGLSKMEFYDKIGIKNAFSVYGPDKPGQKIRRAKAPSAETVLRIANIFHASVDWLLTGQAPGGSSTERVISTEKELMECPVRRAHMPSDSSPPKAGAVQHLGMAWSVLESDTRTAIALRYNVEEFYEKVYAPPGRVNGAAGGGAGGAGDLKSPEGGKGQPSKRKRKAS